MGPRRRCMRVLLVGAHTNMNYTCHRTLFARNHSGLAKNTPLVRSQCSPSVILHHVIILSKSLISEGRSSTPIESLGAHWWDGCIDNRRYDGFLEENSMVAANLEIDSHSKLIRAGFLRQVSTSTFLFSPGSYLFITPGSLRPLSYVAFGPPSTG